LVAALLIGLGIFPLLTLKEPIWSLVVLGVLVAAAGLFHSLLAGFKELAQSKIPPGTNAALARSQKPGPADEKPKSQYSLGRDTSKNTVFVNPHWMRCGECFLGCGCQV
jgi:hypothetical protein